MADTDLTVSVSVDGGGRQALVVLGGEVDVVTAAKLRHALGELLAAGRTSVTVDLSELTFMDSTGLGVLVVAMKRMREAGGDMDLRHPRPPVVRLLEISGIARTIAVGQREGAEPRSR